MKFQYIFSKIVYLFALIMIVFNLYLVYQKMNDRKSIEKLGFDLYAVKKQNYEYKLFIHDNIRLFHIPIKNISKRFEILKEYKRNPSYIILIPTHACKACVTIFFSEMEKIKLQPENFFLISELNDPILKRQWISYGYDRKKFSIDEYGIFNNSGITNKIVIIKLKGDLTHYDFFQYEIFLSDLLLDFLNEV